MKDIAGYLFATFTGEQPDGEQIYFALSRDGFHWKDLNGAQPVLRSDVGTCGVRDPFLLRGKDRYYLIATDLHIASGISWEAAVQHGSRCVVVWESVDLVHWSQPRMCEIAPEGAGCVWAPEVVSCPEDDRYMVFWASHVHGKHRIYRTFTRDFRTFTKAEPYLEQPYDVIDMTILPSQGRFLRFYKDEVEKYIRVDAGTELDGMFYSVHCPVLDKLIGVEGPTIFPLRNGGWCLLVDQFAAGKGYLPLVCEDLMSGVFHLLPENYFDMGSLCKRHGSVLPLSEQEYQAVQRTYATEIE